MEEEEEDCGAGDGDPWRNPAEKNREMEGRRRFFEVLDYRHDEE